VSGAPLCWIDGTRVDLLPADDRGLYYGDGLFETILVRAGRARFLEAHLARLSLGCARLDIPFTAMPELRAEIAIAVSQAPALAVLKIIVTRGSATRRGYAPQGTETPRRVLSVWPSAAPTAAMTEGGVAMNIATLRLAEQPVLAGIKHLNRLENVLAAAEAAAAGTFDALLLNASGQVISGAMSNVFAVRAGRVVTPRLDRCGVSGVMRAVVLRECVVLGIGASEGRLSLDELLAAEEVFITNARIGVVPVRRLGEHSYRMDLIAHRLKAHIEPLDA
jgi:4-amino-4-deoxychorismate lyase